MNEYTEYNFVEDFILIVYTKGQLLSTIDEECENYIDKHQKEILNIHFDKTNHEQINWFIEKEFFDVLGKSPQKIQSNSAYINSVRNSFKNVISNFDLESLDSDKKSLLNKILDHISQKLEVLTINYNAYSSALLSNIAIDNKKIADLQKSYNDMQSSFTQLQADYHTQKDEYDELTENIKKSQKQIVKNTFQIEESRRKANEAGIAILSIFSALVLAFNGAIIFSSATLKSMNTTSIYRLLISIVTLGIVFINIAYALFHFISALIERNSLIKRQNTSESENKDAKNKKKRSKLFDRTHLIIINFVTLLIIIAIVCCWNFGVVEKRNQRLEQELTSMVEISDTNTTTIDDLTEMNNVEY